MSKFLFLCFHMSSLCSMFGLCYLLLLHPCSTSCQHQIPLFQPLLLLLLILIRIQIVVLLRLIRDQKLCYGFTLEIAGHDGIQESTLTLPLCHVSGSLEKSGQGSCGALTLRGGTVTICDMYLCWTYFPQSQTRSIDPRSILLDQNKGQIRQPELGCKHRCSHLCTITFST